MRRSPVFEDNANVISLADNKRISTRNLVKLLIPAAMTTHYRQSVDCEYARNVDDYNNTCTACDALDTIKALGTVEDFSGTIGLLESRKPSG